MPQQAGVSEANVTTEVTTDQRALAAWRDRVCNASLPVFSRTVSQVGSVTADRETSARDLAAVIEQDANLAARLLKIVNSSLFNLQGNRIDTISAAVVMLGFDSVRELAVSVALIEEVLKGPSHQKLLHTLSRSFHAAVQAKRLASLVGDQAPDEVFVATLLRDLGEIAYWSLADSDDDGVRELGFGFDELSLALARTWQLGPLVERCIARDDECPRAGLATAGHRIALTVAKVGWSGPETAREVDRIAGNLGIKPDVLEAELENNFEQAARVAAGYGLERMDAVPDEPQTVERTVAATGPGPEAQLKVLQQVTQAYEKPTGALDEVMRLIVEGIHDAIGFDRVYFALFSPDRSLMQVKYVAGSGMDALVGARLRISAGDAVAQRLEQGDAAIARDGLPSGRSALEADEAALMLVQLEHKPVGLLYSDRAASGSSIDAASFAAFRLFAAQISAALESVRRV